MRFLSFGKKKSSSTTSNTPAANTQPRSFSDSAIAEEDRYPPLEEICHITSIEPIIDISRLLEEFQAGLARLDGRLPSAELKQQAESLGCYASSAADAGEFHIMEQIFASLEKFEQLTAPPTSGTAFDDLRVDLATLRGLLTMSGGRS